MFAFYHLKRWRCVFYSTLQFWGIEETVVCWQTRELTHKQSTLLLNGWQYHNACEITFASHTLQHSGVNISSRLAYVLKRADAVTCPWWYTDYPAYNVQTSLLHTHTHQHIHAICAKSFFTSFSEASATFRAYDSVRLEHGWITDVHFNVYRISSVDELQKSTFKFWIKRFIVQVNLYQILIKVYNFCANFKIYRKFREIIFKIHTTKIGAALFEIRLFNWILKWT